MANLLRGNSYAKWISFVSCSSQKRHGGDWIIVVAIRTGKTMTDSRDIWEEE